MDSYEREGSETGEGNKTLEGESLERSRWKKVVLCFSIGAIVLLGVAFAQQIADCKKNAKNIGLFKESIEQGGPNKQTYLEFLSEGRKNLTFEIFSSIGTLLSTMVLVGANLYIWKYQPLTAEERAERKVQKQEAKLQRQEARKEGKRRKLQEKMDKLK